MLYMFQLHGDGKNKGGDGVEASQFYWKLPKNKVDYVYQSRDSKKLHTPIPLCMTVCPEAEKMVLAYDNNKIQVLDINNKCLHPWTRQNETLFPANFLNRYNRLIGVTALSADKFLFYSNYTYTILDVSLNLASLSSSSGANGENGVKIIQNHPGKPISQNSTWFECIKKSQEKYLEKVRGIEKNAEQPGGSVQDPADGEGSENLTISNSIKGILWMDYDLQRGELNVVEN